MAYKTSSIDLNVPAKVIPVNCSGLSENARWPHQNTSDDKWWSGGQSPRAYTQITRCITKPHVVPREPTRTISKMHLRRPKPQ